MGILVFRFAGAVPAGGRGEAAATAFQPGVRPGNRRTGRAPSPDHHPKGRSHISAAAVRSGAERHRARCGHGCGRQRRVLVREGSVHRARRARRAAGLASRRRGADAACCGQPRTGGYAEGRGQDAAVGKTHKGLAAGCGRFILITY